MGSGPARPVKHGGGLMGTVDVVVVVVVVVHHTSWAAVRAGPIKTHGPPHGPGGTAHIEPNSHGSRPGPAHQVSRRWSAARPAPSNFQRMGCGSAPRRGPAHHIFKCSRPGPARHSFQIGPARPGRDKQPMTSPANISIHVIPSSLVNQPASTDVLNLSPRCTSSTTSFFGYDTHSAIPFRSQPKVRN